MLIHDDDNQKPLLMIGWREWLALPELGIARIKAKVDTGARTSALHAFRVDTFEENGQLKVSFSIHPIQKNTRKVITCVADIVDNRLVTDSGGHKEQRFVIKTQAVLGETSWPIEITLTNRDDMRFRMLLGRSAMQNNVIINPAASYLLGKRHTHRPL